MATLFLADLEGGRRVLGMALHPEDLEHLADGEACVVEMSATTQHVLETHADAVMLLPIEEAELLEAAKRVRGLVVNEVKPH